MSAETVRVELGDRSYPIVVDGEGPEGLGRRLSGALPQGPLAVIADARVAALYGEVAAQGLRAAGFDPRVWTVPPGERSKSLSRVRTLYRALLGGGIDRSAGVLALGGGVASDIAGFVAATLMRGVPWAAAPTTLLAQVDAAIGGKTGVNLPEGKNLVGAFHQPRAVVAHLPTLATLPPRELRSGLAETLKYGVIAAPEMFDAVGRDAGKIASADAEALRPLVAACARIKAAVVGRDELERTGERAVLNFGHTLGHAFEARYGFRRLRHGEAVGLGMVAAADVSRRLGLAAADVADTIVGALRAVGLADDYRSLLDDDTLALLGADKKKAGGAIRFVAVRELGRTELVSLRPEELGRLLMASD